MADLFGNRGFWQDSGCVSTEKKEGKTEDSDLVLICFQISVWSGTTTEQTSIEEGAEFMKRRRIIPGVMLKPFLDFRARAKALCQEMGEPLSQRFRDAKAGCCRRRAGPECLEKRILPAARLRFLRRPMKTFLLRGSKVSFLRDVRRMPFFLRRILFCVGSALSLMRLFWPPTARASEAQRMLFWTAWPSVLPMRLISSVRRLNLPTSRKRLSVGSELLYERVRSWSCSQTRFALASAALEEALAEGGRTHVWCRNKKLFVQCLENAREAFAQAGAAHEQNTTEEAELLVTRSFC